jgi:hypothetical protein
MSTARVWLFRFLVVIGIAALVFSWFQPWWSTHVNAMPGTEWPVKIRPYGLDTAGFWEVLTLMPEGGHEADMPVWFTPVMWVYFGLAVLLLLAVLWFVGKNKKIGLLGRKFNLSSFLLFGVGISYIVVAILAVVVASIRLKAIGMTLTGEVFVQMGTYSVWELETTATSVLRFGYWLAVATGPFILLLGILRSKIAGNPQSNS